MALRFWSVTSLVLAITATHAQSPPAAPAFEVASVRRNTSGTSRGTARIPDSGQVTITNAPLRVLITHAYQVGGFSLVVAANHPLLERDLLAAPKFDVQAKPPDDAPPGTQRLMLQKLLMDRFKLRAHRETRMTPMYALTVMRKGRLGPDLSPTQQSCAAWRTAIRSNPTLPQPRHRNGTPLCYTGDLPRQPGVTVLRDAGPAAEIARQIQGFVDRPLFDETGLTGNVEWTLVFANAPNATHPSILTAVEEQLGLKLEPRTAPYEVLVIDSVDWPTPD
ncbi:MAG: TIGR03435 family protein [Vicinamibacterales bacterium]